MHPRRLLLLLGGTDSFVVVVAAALSVLLARPCSADTSPSATTEDSRLQDLYRDGRKARERGDLPTALRLLEQAWSIRHTHDSAASLAQVEFELGKAREAAEHLAFAIDHLPADVEPERAKRVREAFERIRKEIVTLHLHIEPKTAEVFLNGKSLGLASDLSKDVYVDPGKVQVSANAEGYLPWSIALSTKAGDAQDVTAELKASARQGGAGSAGQSGAELNTSTPYRNAPVPSQQPPAEETRPWWPVAVPAGATAVGLAVGIIFTVKAGSSKDDADHAQAQIGNPSGCASADSGRAALCTQLRNSRDDQKNANRVANTALIAAGVFGAVTAVAGAWFLWPKAEHVAASRVRVAPVFARESATLSIEGSF